MIRRCDLVPQYEVYKEEIQNAIARVLQSGQYILGENVEGFETEFSNYLGAKYGVGVNSGTDALMFALWSCGLKPGDEVITTPFTAIPTYSAIRHVGAEAVFADIDPTTFLLDLKQVEQAMSERTRAIVPVHLFGNAVDVEGLRRIVGPNVYIVEDCAQSHGASVRGKMTGTLGDVAAFSFYPSKNLGCYGDGGMVVTNNKDIADMVRSRRMYGLVNKDEFVVDGVNSRLDEIQAAILRVKLKYLDSMNARRNELAAIYARLFDSRHIVPQAVCNDVQPVHHVYCALCSGSRDALVASLEKKNIQTNVYYSMPLASQKGYRRTGPKPVHLPVADCISERIIALPFYPEIHEEYLYIVASGIKEFYESFER